MSLQNVSRVLLAVGLFAALFLLSGPRPAPGQDAVLEPWLAGEDALPAVAGDAPEAAEVLVRYWEPDSPGRIAREWGNLLARARLAREQGVAGELLGEIEREAARVIEAAGKGGPALSHHAGELGARLAGHRAALNALVTAAPVFAASWVEPYSEEHRTVWPERADKWTAFLPPAEPVRAWEILALPGEHHAAALLVVNATAETRRASIRVAGLDPGRFALEARRHVFVEDWYRRGGQRRTADPLARLEKIAGREPAARAWHFDLPPGAVVKLHLDIHARPGAGGGVSAARVRVDLAGAAPQDLSLTLRVPAAPAPVTRFEHLAFMLMGWPGAASGADLAAHGVTIFQHQIWPSAEFDEEGNLVSEVDFGASLRRLEANLAHVDRAFLFLMLRNLRAAGGEVLAYGSPEWAIATASYLRAFLEQAASAGFGPERFMIMPWDEIHGGGFNGGEVAEGVHRWAEAFRILKEKVPELPIVTTFYAACSPAVLKMMTPYIDIYAPHMNWPESHSSSPADYNPRLAFEREMVPLMERERASRGARTISYRVASGPSDGLLGGNRAYPILAAGRGFTGISHWAYNDRKGSTWHPWDGPGSGLDYIFVYDGAEEHPFNHYWNPTQEAIVPSIRWRAVRAGVQDAHLLLWFREQLDAGRLAGEAAARARAALEEAGALASGERELSEAGVARLSRELREIYVAAAAR